mmetsp:Transcript_48589/g.157477  ORF Transcript_48589/g.157477 Transcript_48589/m.157477 type:complete len:287 (+) Transcript_48589:32-892(+)
MSIKSFFKAAPKPADPAAAAAPALRFELHFSRTSKVVEWDDGLFTDCRPSEAQDAQEETIRLATRYDFKDDVDDDMMESFILDKYTDHDALYDSAAEANEAAKQFVEVQLQSPLNVDIARQEQVANGELPPGYQLPPADSVAKETAMTNGRGTYSGSVPFFCDPYGADVWTVCVTTFTVRVVVEGDTSPPPDTAPAAAAKKAAGGKTKATTQRKPASLGGSGSGSSKGISKPSATVVSKKPRARSGGGGGARILSVPGLSKKEVAALNKAARASAKRMAADSDDDW